MNSTSISRRESEIINKIKEHELVVFTPKDVQRFLGISDRNTYQILQRMKQKNSIINVEQGKYMLKEQWNSLDIYDVASLLITPSYIGFWSALHIHHLTDQVPQKIFVVTTKRKRSQRLQHQKITFVTIKPHWFFGYERYDDLIVSDKEKTIIDCLHIPSYAGGISQIYHALSDELNIERLISYCQQTKSSTIASRLGFLLEKKQLLKDKSSLEEMITSYALIDPEKENKKLNSKWKLYTGGEIK
jgi:predicted transcriptional regulator of viral defense system